MLTEMLGQKQVQAVNDISGLIVKSKSSGSGSGAGSGSGSSPTVNVAGSSTVNVAGSSTATPKVEEVANTGLKRKAEEPAGESLKAEEDADKKVKV